MESRKSRKGRTADLYNFRYFIGGLLFNPVSDENGTQETNSFNKRLCNRTNLCPTTE